MAECSLKQAACYAQLTNSVSSDSRPDRAPEAFLLQKGGGVGVMLIIVEFATSDFIGPYLFVHLSKPPEPLPPCTDQFVM